MPLRSAAGLTLAVFAFAVHAGPPALTPGETKTVEILSELHHARHLLDHANHDYDGHRARAVEDVEKAIKIVHATLPAHHHHHVKKPGAKTGKNGPSHEDQGASDMQLREARRKLEVVERQLASSGDQSHQTALIDVASAIKQIDHALKVR